MFTTLPQGQFLIHVPIMLSSMHFSFVLIIVLYIDNNINVYHLNALLAGFDVIVDIGAVMHHCDKI